MIGGHDKLFVPKLDSLWKHANQREAIIAMPCVWLWENTTH